MDIGGGNIEQQSVNRIYYYIEMLLKCSIMTDLLWEYRLLQHKDLEIAYVHTTGRGKYGKNKENYP